MTFTSWLYCLSCCLLSVLSRCLDIILDISLVLTSCITSLLCARISICPTSDRKVEVEHFISERIHKPIALRFWVRVWCLSHLCGCSSLYMSGPPGSPRDPTVVSKSSFDERFDRVESLLDKECLSGWFR